jgi:hypothetical protein
VTRRRKIDVEFLGVRNYLPPWYSSTRGQVVGLLLNDARVMKRLLRNLQRLAGDFSASGPTQNLHKYGVSFWQYNRFKVGYVTGGVRPKVAYSEKMAQSR